jgi:hypothetical protein
VKTRARVTAVAILGSSILLIACGDDYRRTLQDGFDHGIGVDGDVERNFRGAMVHYHMAERDIDCMVSHAFAQPANQPSSEQPYEWSAAELNEFASTCGVDFSRLWYMTD